MLQAHKVRWIIQNRTGRVCEVRNIIAHPDFEGAASPDLGLIRIETDKLDGDPAALPLASTDAAANLGVGTHVGTIGFPGELQRNYLNRIDKKTQRFESVLATFKDGWVGRLTTYDGRHNDPAKHVLIQHSASLSGGTSGSPMFLHDGTVVAISNSSISQRLAARDPNTSGPSLLSAAEIGFAIRVDELTRFAKVIPWARDRLP
jgi:S1-C subfamily serine protease